MKIVVTGASGFLGSAVMRAASGQSEHQVIGVSRRGVPGLMRVTHYGQVPGGDVLIHLAEDNDRARVEMAGESYARGVRETLQALLRKQYSRVIYASSGVLYDDRGSKPRTPDDPVAASDRYARVKLESEAAVLEQRGCVARLANLYGPGMPGSNVFSDILGQIPGAGPLRIRDASPVRDFLWVDDAADGFLRLALAAGETTGILNLGTGTGTAIGDVARMCLEQAGETGREVASASTQQAPSAIILDPSLTTRVCGWQPRTSLRDGIANILQGIRIRS
jgi:nucleoside-diphosphate-sugar epimerase